MCLASDTVYNNILNEISCSRIIPAVTHFRHFELESFAEEDSVFSQTVNYQRTTIQGAQIEVY